MSEARTSVRHIEHIPNIAHSCSFLRPQCLHILWFNFLPPNRPSPLLPQTGENIFLLTNFLIIYTFVGFKQLIFSCYCRDQMSFISQVKVAAQILGLVILIITLILTFRRLLANNTAINAQIIPGSNLAGSDGVTNSSSQDDIQMIAMNVNLVTM